VEGQGMTASIVQSTTESITLQITIPLSQSFLDTEETIQSVLNEAGTLASGEALKQFDTDGSAIEMGGMNWTSKGQLPKTYQTPYGTIEPTFRTLSVTLKYLTLKALTGKGYAILVQMNYLRLIENNLILLR
jgi:hypothetical protein